MDPELEGLLKAWEAYLETPRGPEAERLRAIYESKVEEVALARKFPPESVHRVVRRFYRRWQRSTDPGYPKLPPRA